MAGRHSLGILARRPGMTFPPGQHPIEGFPRFGTHLHRPPPAVPIDPVIEVSGAVAKPFRPATGRARDASRRQLTAQGHRPLRQLRSAVLSEWRRP